MRHTISSGASVLKVLDPNGVGVTSVPRSLCQCCLGKEDLLIAGGAADWMRSNSPSAAPCHSEE